MTKVELRPADIEDLKAFYDKPGIGPSVRALVGLVDGRPIGIGGLGFKSGIAVVFLDISDEARKYKVTLHKTALRIVAEARKHHKIVFAECAENELGAKRWLERLGFEHAGANLFRLRV